MSLDLPEPLQQELRLRLTQGLNHYPPTEWRIASDLLRGEMGPLSDGSLAYSDAAVRAAAYWTALCYRYSRASGVLKGRPAYEAREMLGHRARGAANRAGSMHEWGLLLLSGVGVHDSRMSVVLRQWWRDATQLDDGSGVEPSPHERWAAVRSSLDDVLLAAELLSPWLHSIRPERAGGSDV